MSTYKVGLTGLIGSGKSLAANYFSTLGVDIVDTDVISHKITSVGGVALPKIKEAFGQNYLTTDGGLNRDKMRELVFKDLSQKHKLESILHPLIFEEIALQVLQSKSVYTMIVVPLLFSSPRYASYIDRSIFIDCDEEVLISRVMKRNGWRREIVLDILKNQMPRLEQLKRADDVLNNNEMPLDLELQVRELHSKYKSIINGYYKVKDSQ